MNHFASQLAKNRILNLIEKIENKRGQMFHEIYPELVDAHIRVMDNKAKPHYLINELCKILDGISAE